MNLVAWLSCAMCVVYILTISSTVFPKVALIRPPIKLPHLSPMVSEASDRRADRGMMASTLLSVTSVSGHRAQCAAKPNGTNTSNESAWKSRASVLVAARRIVDTGCCGRLLVSILRYGLASCAHGFENVYQTPDTRKVSSRRAKAWETVGVEWPCHGPWGLMSRSSHVLDGNQPGQAWQFNVQSAAQMTGAHGPSINAFQTDGPPLSVS